MSFEVIKPGFLTLVQDFGRFSFGRFGLNQSGASDEHAFCWANHLLGNTHDCAALEITLGGCVLEARADSQIAVTGADFNFKINGQIQGLWQTLNIKAGDILSWGMAKEGCGIRCYLAVKGGLKTEQQFGSRSVSLREGVGRALKQGDMLGFLPMQPETAHVQRIPWFYRPRYDKAVVLGLIKTYQFDEFKAKDKALFFQQTYRISANSDRSGCRLEGEQLSEIRTTMISEVMSYGSVEITKAGQPIILLKEAPTIGGYPKMGTVFSLDLAKLAQAGTGAMVIFKLMSIEEAQAKRREFNHFFGID